MKNMQNKTLCIFALLVACFLCVSPTVANAVTVTTVVDSADVEGSLRWALNEVEDGGVISFDITSLSDDVISLEDTLEINRDVTIQGPGPDLLTISGQDLYRIFWITSSATSVDISGISFENGNSSNGGAIYFDADNLTIDNCHFLGNRSYGHGGAIHLSDGNVTILNSLFQNNEARAAGAIYTRRNLIIDNCEFILNAATVWQGGAVYSYELATTYSNTRLSVSNSTFEQNFSNGGEGGAICYHANDLEITNCNFTDNGKNSSDEKVTNQGGAVWLKRHHYHGTNYVSYKIKDCSFFGNAASDAGGAMYINNTLDYVPVTVENCVFTDNVSTRSGGAISLVNVLSADINTCVLSGNNAGDEGEGGGIYSIGDSDYNYIISLRNSTINGNSAKFGGGIYAQSNYGTFNLLNCTIAENSASGNGGGIKNPSNLSSINISNCTIYGNSLETSDQYGNAINNAGTMNLKNTIVVCNTDGNGATDNQIYNVPEEKISFSIVSDDVVSSDLFSGGLASNDGPLVGSTVSGDQYPILTLALKEGSPAIEKAASTDIDGDVVSEDQRGVERPKGLGYDIGAYELIYDPVYYHISTEPSPGGYFDPVSADVLEGTDKTFTVTPYDGFLIEELFVDGEQITDFTPVGYTYTFENVSSDLELRANFMIDPEMMEESGVEDLDVNETTKGPQSLTDPEGITKDAIRSISFSSLTSADIGEDLSDTDFATGLSFEIGFVSPDAGTAVTQLDLVMEVSRDLLGADTCATIDSGDDLETAFFENVSIYKIVSPDAYDLFEIASADFDATDFFKVYDDESNYYISMSMVIADEAAPQEEEPLQALEEGQDSYFFVYDGVKDGKFTDPIVALRKSADPVDPVNPDSNGGGTCSVGTFTPLAALLLLPVLLMFKK